MSKMINLSFIAFVIITICGSSLSSVIECEFDDHKYDVLGKIYRCEVINNPKMNTPGTAMITNVKGKHEDSRNNTHVIGFRAGGSKMEVFPKYMLQYFPNLQAIVIKSSEIREIYRTDLKSFYNLVYLKIDGSKIEVLEQGLFDYNRQLQVLGINSKKMIHIDPNVFDKLTNLRYFLFEDVPCVEQEVRNLRRQVIDAIKIVKNQCTANEFIDLNNQFEILKIETTQNISSEDLELLFYNFEMTFNNSIFSKYRPLKNEYNSLKNNGSISKLATILPILLLFLYGIFN
ncbi:hypothetical protein ACKWTF_014459 [Chironomus riparius]